MTIAMQLKAVGESVKLCTRTACLGNGASIHVEDPLSGSQILFPTGFQQIWVAFKFGDRVDVGLPLLDELLAVLLFSCIGFQQRSQLRQPALLDEVKVVLHTQGRTAGAVVLLYERKVVLHTSECTAVAVRCMTSQQSGKHQGALLLL